MNWNALLELLRAAVDRALAEWSWEEVGVVCSGGLDSSTIACLAAEGRDPFRLFTGYYNDPGFDERQFSRLVPGVHHEVRIRPEDFVAEFDNMAAALLPPWQGPGCFGQWMVAKRMAEQGVRVCLSGEGADELFGGYARVLQVAGWPLPDGYPPSYKPPQGYPRDLEKALAWEMNHLHDLLACDAAILGAHGIEGRAPFTYPSVVDYALSLEPGLRIGKSVLRRAVHGIVPQPIRERTDKMGFPIPLVRWAHDEPVRSFVRDRIGYTPRSDRPFAREWWNDLLEATAAARV